MSDDFQPWTNSEESKGKESQGKPSPQEGRQNTQEKQGQKKEESMAEIGDLIKKVEQQGRSIGKTDERVGRMEGSVSDLRKDISNLADVLSQQSSPESNPKGEEQPKGELTEGQIAQIFWKLRQQEREQERQNKENVQRRQEDEAFRKKVEGYDERLQSLENQVKTICEDTPENPICKIAERSMKDAVEALKGGKEESEEEEPEEETKIEEEQPPQEITFESLPEEEQGKVRETIQGQVMEKEKEKLRRLKEDENISDEEWTGFVHEVRENYPHQAFWEILQSCPECWEKLKGKPEFKEKALEALSDQELAQKCNLDDPAACKELANRGYRVQKQDKKGRWKSVLPEQEGSKF